MASPALVARAAGWTPEEAARYQVALLRGLAADRKAQRLYLRKVQIVEMMRTKTTTEKQEGTLLEANTKNLDKAAAVAGGRSSSSSGQPTGAAAKSRARRRKSEAQRLKSVEKLQHEKVAESLRGRGGEGGRQPAERSGARDRLLRPLLAASAPRGRGDDGAAEGGGGGQIQSCG